MHWLPAGVTGARETTNTRVDALLQDLHSVTDKSVAVGFGVSRPEHAAQIVAWGAEGVICGSALVRGAHVPALTLATL